MKLPVIISRRKRIEDSLAYSDALARARLVNFSARGSHVEPSEAAVQWAADPLLGNRPSRKLPVDRRAQAALTKEGFPLDDSAELVPPTAVPHVLPAPVLAPSGERRNPYPTGPMPAVAVEAALAAGDAVSMPFRLVPTFTPGPGFTAAADETGSMPAFHDPLDPAEPVRVLAAPVIGDSVPVPLSFRPESPARAAEPGADVMLYCAPGWTALLTSERVRSGEWDEIDSDIEAGYGRNAAAQATMRRHVRENIPGTLWRLCAGAGHPEIAVALLHRARELRDLKAAGGAA